MKDFVDGNAFNNEQGNRARKLFAAVVLAALDDAIADDKKYGNGPEQIARKYKIVSSRYECQTVLPKGNAAGNLLGSPPGLSMVYNPRVPDLS